MNKNYYGFTYMGSKNKLSDFLIENMFMNELDKTFFVDLFSGGLSVSSMASNLPFEKVFANDLNKYVIALEKLLLTKKNVPLNFLKFVHKEDFEFIRENPNFFPPEYVGFVLTVYSFGCDQRTYLYAKDIEYEIEAIHNILVYNDFSLSENFDVLYGIENFIDFKHDDYLSYPEDKTSELRLCLKKFSEFKKEPFLKRICEMKHLNIYRSMLKMLAKVKPEKIEFNSADYADFYNSLPQSVLSRAIIYCDPPYESTKKYPYIISDYDKFWDFFRNCPYPVYVSSYDAPKDIKPYATKKTIQLMDNGNGNKNLFREKENSVVFENLYYNGK